MENKKNDMLKYIILIAVMVVIIIGYTIYNKSRENYKYLKVNKSKNLVYTESKKTSGNYNQYKPFLNIKGKLINDINNDITEYINEYSKKNVAITYDYSINGKILSLIIKIEDYSYLESTVLLNFRTYNLNIDKRELLTNEKVINYFGLTNNDLETVLNSKIEEQYYNLVNSESLDGNSCDIDCYYNSRKISRGIEDVELYINKGKLEAYKPYAYITKDKNDRKYGFQITN